jgi:hypothetical protein
MGTVQAAVAAAVAVPEVATARLPSSTADTAAAEIRVVKVVMPTTMRTSPPKL